MTNTFMVDEVKSLDMNEFIGSEMDVLKKEFCKELQSQEIVELMREDKEFAKNADSLIRELTAKAMAEAKKII